MDDKKRQLRRTAAEEFMRSLEQLGELLSDDDLASPVSKPDPKSDSALKPRQKHKTSSQETDEEEDEGLTKALGDFFRSPETD